MPEILCACCRNVNKQETIQQTDTTAVLRRDYNTIIQIDEFTIRYFKSALSVNGDAVASRFVQCPSWRGFQHRVRP